MNAHGYGPKKAADPRSGSAANFRPDSARTGRASSALGLGGGSPNSIVRDHRSKPDDIELWCGRRTFSPTRPISSPQSAGIRAQSTPWSRRYHRQLAMPGPQHHSARGSSYGDQQAFHANGTRDKASIRSHEHQCCFDHLQPHHWTLRSAWHVDVFATTMHQAGQRSTNSNRPSKLSDTAIDLAGVDPQFRADVLAGFAMRPQLRSRRAGFTIGADRSCSRTSPSSPNIIRPGPRQALLERHCREIANVVGPGRAVVEFGSGSSAKTPILLGCIAPAAYVPIDISGDFLRQSRRRARRCLPGAAGVAARGRFHQAA